MLTAIKWLGSALAVITLASAAIAGDWRPMPSPKDSSLVAAGFTHDDGGSLVVACNTKTNLIMIGIVEPRAHWEKGAPMQVTTRNDGGGQLSPSRAVAIAPTEILIEEDSTWDLSTMGDATNFFFTGVGGYARVWPRSAAIADFADGLSVPGKVTRAPRAINALDGRSRPTVSGARA